MLIIEDTKTGELVRITTIDAFVQLGFVKVGTQVHNFDPVRLMSYYNLVDNKIIEFASKYSDAFRHMPRRAYDYLRPPPILDDVYPQTTSQHEGCWFIDLFILRPVMEIGSVRLPERQRIKNFKLTYNYSMKKPHSVRFYHLQDMRNGERTPQGYGCAIRAADFQDIGRGPNNTELLQAARLKKPIFIEMDDVEDLDVLLEWLVAFKEREEAIPVTILSVDDHKRWGKRVGRLAEIPNSLILTAGSTISSLSTIVSSLKRVSSNWSERLVFGSAYPETHMGDGISEIISFLLSRSLNATKEELQRILGGNILQLLTPRPMFLHFMENKATVVAEGALGKSAMREFARLSHILSTRKVRNPISVDFMLSKNGGIIDHNTAIVNYVDSALTSASSVALLTERDGTLRISGWKEMFAESLKMRNSDMFTTLVRASTQSTAPILNAPSHITRFNEEILRCLQVPQPQEILSALHFKVQTGDLQVGTFLVSDKDMRALDLQSDDVVLVFDPVTNNWCAGRVGRNPEGRAKQIVMSNADTKFFGLQSDCVVDLVKYEGTITPLISTVLAVDNEESTFSAEDAAFIHLHQEEIKSTLHDRVIGFGERIYIDGENHGLFLTLSNSTPTIQSGVLGSVDANRILIRPSQYLREFNMILAISVTGNSKIEGIKLKSLQSIRARLHPLIVKVPEINQFLLSLGPEISPIQATVLFCLVTISQILLNRTNGKLGVALPEKFSIQKGSMIQPFVHFAEDLESDEVLISLVYSLLDRAQDDSQSERSLDSYRSIAEQMDDFGPELPTMIMFFTDEPIDKNHQSPFLKSISRHQLYSLDVLGLGLKSTERGSKTALKTIMGEFIPLEILSLYAIEDYLLSTINKLTSRSS